MTEQVYVPPSRRPWWLAPVAVFVALMTALGGVVLLARDAGRSEAPPAIGAFQQPQGLAYRAYDVERADAEKLTLTSGPAQDRKTIDLEVSGARVWFLEPADASGIQPPMVVNVVAIQNEVRNYTIRLMAFAPLTISPDVSADFIPLADEFGGFETSQDPRERVVVSAVLESFDGRTGVTRTSTGPGTLFIDPGAPVRVLRSGNGAEIKPGDRVAIHLDSAGQPDPSRGVLVLTGGVQE